MNHTSMYAKNHTAYLSLGSNLGDRKANLEEGLQMLAGTGIRPQRVSSLFETEPVDNLNQPWFLNLAVEAETDLSPGDLLRCCLQIEMSRGRIRTFRGAPRTLDLDILLYGDLVLQDPHLTIPHPRMVGRRFVLEPLAEIAPQVLHPVLKKSVLSLLLSCPDLSTVQRYSPGDTA
jgi:2-amino-4-hydroxy-6-hydroxymethyldihydropteridine diphosphokinase